jgi:hypothetical protein
MVRVIDVANSAGAASSIIKLTVLSAEAREASNSGVVEGTSLAV